jgi:hypothetical protein
MQFAGTTGAANYRDSSRWRSFQDTFWRIHRDLVTDRSSRESMFEAFYTTKPRGLGVGRSIVENHGRRLRAMPNDGPGATFQFTLLKCP